MPVNAKVPDVVFVPKIKSIFFSVPILRCGGFSSFHVDVRFMGYINFKVVPVFSLHSPKSVIVWKEKRLI